ncbi:proton-conducting transporter membrane subunit [Legionella worsleiensis]|uniref:NADH-ubiquinone oxidoreductase chain 5 n=1 Tax=Legionella worsleiensis TaxID=45076 RepID=A0A0W1AKK8_9GAMM|nr:proton-conducting transporter membrane subunit [Legionella worsleiensis]KTD81900.1 NADH-ubiquinone oxidoreductase chain 5 [Legionella worsleiensis]STY31209.1 NADH-ubiquinone oxidoreductase chain 5 [Legionella worsleiensis]
MSNVYLIFCGLMLACPFFALFLCSVLTLSSQIAARCAGYLMGAGFLVGVGLLSYISWFNDSVTSLFITINPLNVLLSCLVLLVSFIVHRFSLRYMHGDRLYRRFFLLLSALTLTVLLMVLADNLYLFWGSWTLSNAFLVMLMVHKKEWIASRQSGLLAFYTLGLGSILLLVGLILLAVSDATCSLDVVNQLKTDHIFLHSVSLGLIVVAALTQCGLFPFHRWLISSLNSPTPVSALMHAGLVNGGGILLVKFAPLMMAQQGLLYVLFIVGAVSAILGTVWKLMQHDIKRMLACSTMAQMGFMMMQCGVGLFAAAIAHLCWHGLFKAYQFLSSGSAVKQQKSAVVELPASFMMVVISFVGGLLAMSTFAWATNKSFTIFDASTFVLFFAFIAGSQLMLTWIRTYRTLFSGVTGLVLAALSGLMYGMSIHLVECLIPGISTLQAPQLSTVHWVIMSLFGFLWLAFNFGLYQKSGQSKLGCWLYMTLFNSSQPSAKTVTALRSDYNY